MSSTIKIRRGLQTNVAGATASTGEPLYTTDSQKFYIYDGSTKVQVGGSAVANLSGTNTGDQTITLTSDVTGSGTGSFATTVAKIQGTTVSGTTGSGNVAFSTSPSFTTPSLGVASATTINKVTLTTPATGSTLTILDNKTFTVNNTLTLSATDGGSVAFGGGGTVTYTTNNLSVFASTTSAQLAGVISDETGTGSLVFSSSPVLTTPNLGTPSSLVGTNITGTASGLTAGTVTTNANLTGDITSSGNATTTAATQANIATLSRTAGVSVHGTNTNDNASAGYVGEHLFQNTLRSSPVSLSTGTAANVLGTALTLTAGDWDLSGYVAFKGSSSAVMQILGHATTQSATLGGTAPSNDIGISDARDGCVASLSQTSGLDSASGNDLSLALAPMRVTLSGSQTIYLIAFAVFSVGTVSAYGRLDARRVR